MIGSVLCSQNPAPLSTQNRRPEPTGGSPGPAGWGDSLHHDRIFAGLARRAHPFSQPSGSGASWAHAPAGLHCEPKGAIRPDGALRSTIDFAASPSLRCRRPGWPAADWLFEDRCPLVHWLKFGLVFPCSRRSRDGACRWRGIGIGPATCPSSVGQD
jgi:hypothetical protein